MKSTPKYDWNSEEAKCRESRSPCEFHRYQTVYICGCGKLVSHSQGAWNEHRLHPNGISIPIEYYRHDDTASTLFDRCHAYGCLPYFEDAFQTVYAALADLK